MPPAKNYCCHHPMRGMTRKHDLFQLFRRPWVAAPHVLRVLGVLGRSRTSGHRGCTRVDGPRAFASSLVRATPTSLETRRLRPEQVTNIKDASFGLGHNPRKDPAMADAVVELVASRPQHAGKIHARKVLRRGVTAGGRGGGEGFMNTPSNMSSSRGRSPWPRPAYAPRGGRRQRPGL